MAHHKHLFNFLLNRELDGLYITVAIKSFTFAMILIFLPLYLLNKGYVFQEILLFFIINFVTFLLLTLLMPTITHKIGLKKTILISVVFYSLFYFLLSHLTGTINFLFVLIPVLGGFSYAFFWVPFHSDFTLASSKKVRATQTGLVHILASLLSTVGPIIGGFLIIKIGFDYLLILASLIMLLGLIPLLKTKEVYEKRPGTLKDMFKYLDYRNTLGFFACGVEWAAFAVLWPLFVILVIKEYFVIGILASIPLLATVISVFFTSRIEDKKGIRQVISLGSFFVFINWFLRIFITKPWQIFGISIFQGVEDPLTKVGVDAIGYNRARKSHVIESTCGREFAFNLGRILLLCIAVIIPNFTVLFIIVSLVSIFYFVFALEKKSDPPESNSRSKK